MKKYFLDLLFCSKFGILSNMEKKNECPTNCPFLGIRSYLPESLPFCCEKYNVYLGMSPAKKVLKCPLCLGINVDVQQQGLELLEANSAHVADFKRAFLGMRLADQQKLVSILVQSGIQISWPQGKMITPVNLLAEVTRLFYDKKKREQSPEVQEFVKLLDVIDTDGDPMSPATKTLLSNLFQVLDNSEKGMLLAVLENPARAKNFLDLFVKVPKDQNLLKNFRMLLYDTDKQNSEKVGGNRLLQTEQGKALNLAQHMQLQHLMQQMIQARTRGRNRS